MYELQIAQALREELGDDAYPLDLNEDDTFDERDGATNAAVAVAATNGDDMYSTPEGRVGRGLPANFVTSTPYAEGLRQGIHLEEEQEQDKHLAALRDDENKYLQAGKSAAPSLIMPLSSSSSFFMLGENERLKVLYDARGHELERLKEQVRSLQEEASQETRRLQHERALLLQNQKKLEIEASNFICMVVSG